MKDRDRLAKYCRSCGKKLPAVSLLDFEKMPAVAQHLPETPSESSAADFSVFQCGQCGLVQLDSAPVPYYREVIRSAAVSPEMRDFRLKQFRDWLERSGLQGKKVLECGCGKGEFLELMQLAGADAYGMEFGADNLEACRSQNLKTERCYFENGSEKLASGPFDGFYILNYLEHLPNITDYLKGIYNNLADEGRGLIEVPDFDMMIANSTFAEFMTDHLYYFTRQSLRNLLANNGFDVLSERSVWHNYIISMEVKKRRILDLSAFKTARRRLSQQINALVEKHGASRSAVWGASHQAFAVLALAGLHGKVRCIIDSAAFKQGKYSPATGIPIAAPESLAPGDIDLLLVMAGGYSNEVAKIARRKFGDALEIHILRENRIEKYVNG